MILDDIKKANIEALKNKDTIARGVFSVLLNKIKLLEIAKREKGEQILDADVVAVLQKTLKELAEEKENYTKVNNASAVADAEKQIATLEAFLPKLLSEKEIYDIINAMADKSVPNVMRTFKAEYAGKCDMRLVSEVLKKFN
ncbi:MAG: GatB/YqeY domain-containing protein [Christensenellales bacterium]|jgi:uncharacterized protein YqeY